MVTHISGDSFAGPCALAATTAAATPFRPGNPAPAMGPGTAFLWNSAVDYLTNAGSGVPSRCCRKNLIKQNYDLVAGPSNIRPRHAQFRGEKLPAHMAPSDDRGHLCARSRLDPLFGLCVCKVRMGIEFRGAAKLDAVGHEPAPVARACSPAYLFEYVIDGISSEHARSRRMSRTSRPTRRAARSQRKLKPRAAPLQGDTGLRDAIGMRDIRMSRPMINAPGSSEVPAVALCGEIGRPRVGCPWGV
jgi:hypothetical protein